MGVVANIEGIACNRCSAKVAIDKVDYMNHGLPEGWFMLTWEIYLCPDCVTAVQAVLVPPSNGKASAIEVINRRRAPHPARPATRTPHVGRRG